MHFTQEESMLHQACAMISLIETLHHQNFLESDYYKNLDFGTNEDNIRKILKVSGLGNPATMQMFLHLLLVMPQEMLGKKIYDLIYEPNIKNAVNKTIANMPITVSTNYKGESATNLTSIDYCRHIRNAVAHAQCEYHVIDGICFVIFKDRNPKSKECFEMTMSTADAGGLIHELLKQVAIILNSKVLSEKKSLHTD